MVVMDVITCVTVPLLELLSLMAEIECTCLWLVREERIKNREQNQTKLECFLTTSNHFPTDQDNL